MAAVIPTSVVPSVRPSDATTGQVESRFRKLLADGMELRPAGAAARRPRSLLTRGYTPKYLVELFDTAVYLTNVRQNEDIRFFVTYVVQASRSGPRAHPRIFYKDISLIWRSASHFIRSESENWIGKGDLKTVIKDGEEIFYSAEETTDLPFEIQTALEELCRRATRIPHDEVAVPLVLRRAPDHRIAPYRDFSEPRRRAHSNPRNRINGDRRVAYFSRRNDPTSLRFVSGFEPDFSKGILERSGSVSRIYGGKLERFRILSRNRQIQYLFFAGPQQVWIIPAQTTTTELSSFGVRTIDVMADDDVFLPGYEYHFMEEGDEGPELFSQIPSGFAGPPSEVDPSRADASPWLDQMPVIREFRRRVLGQRRSA